VLPPASPSRATPDDFEMVDRVVTHVRPAIDSGETPRGGCCADRVAARVEQAEVETGPEGAGGAAVEVGHIPLDGASAGRLEVDEAQSPGGRDHVGHVR